MICKVCGHEIEPAEAAIGGWVHRRSNSRWCRTPRGEWVKAAPLEEPDTPENPFGEQWPGPF